LQMESHQPGHLDLSQVSRITGVSCGGHLPQFFMEAFFFLVVRTKSRISHMIGKVLYHWGSLKPSKTENLYPLDSNSPFSPNLCWNQHSLVCLFWVSWMKHI
jgi:hypothetical protein